MTVRPKGKSYNQHNKLKTRKKSDLFYSRQKVESQQMKLLRQDNNELQLKIEEIQMKCKGF